MGLMREGEEIFDEQKRSWERRIIAPDGTQLSFVGIQTENSVVQTDFEQFSCEVYVLPEYFLSIKLVFCFGVEVQLNEEFVGVVLEGFVRSVNEENYGSLQANAEANNGQVMVLVGTQEHSGYLYMFYFIQDFTAQVIMDSNDDFIQSNEEEEKAFTGQVIMDFNIDYVSDEEEEQISYGVVQIFDENQNLIHSEDLENEMEQVFHSNVNGLFLVNTAGFLLLAEYFGINVDSSVNLNEQAEAEAGDILGSPGEGK
ncbi:hypothetical protein SUGI_1523560 [Cryptomeria japonica]|uniref:Uncharacterized protein n=1 Tax=Cryptomeria japonica TaxID=3369 RepID=A0AAD3NTZ8_CRYJA|nr:hypothetical protein SUGI_1523560 [Cryptomeria japonica]